MTKPVVMSDNPLLREYLAASKADHPGNGRPGAGQSYFMTREQLRRKYAYAIPTEEALAFVAAGGPLVEMGAGTGYWAALLTARGADIIAYDQSPPGKTNNIWHKGATTWSDVHEGGPKVLAQHANRTLLLCWPPYESNFALETLRAYRGKQLIYIGESRHGCTANADFFNRLEQEWERTDMRGLPTWEGLHDFVSSWRRRDDRN